MIEKITPLRENKDHHISILTSVLTLCAFADVEDYVCQEFIQDFFLNLVSIVSRDYKTAFTSAEHCFQRL